jgi:gliding motility-associated-like protein
LSVAASGIAPVCFGGDDGTANAVTIGGIPPYNFAWNNTANGDAITGLSAGDYTVSVTDKNGCVAENTITINEPPQVLVTIEMPDDTIPFFGQTVELSVALQNAAGTGTYLWQPGGSLSCVTCPAPVASPAATAAYTLDYVDDNGCAASAEATVYVNRDKMLFIPNAFSPNGDGVNDAFRVFSAGVQSVDAMVFNRWGEKLFQWNGLEGSWDGTYKGTVVDAGVYVYSVQLRWLDGQVKNEKGTVTVVK